MKVIASIDVVWGTNLIRFRVLEVISLQQMPRGIG